MIFSNRSVAVSVFGVIAATALGLVGCSTDDGQPGSSSGSTQTTGDTDASANDSGAETDSGAGGAALGESCGDDGDCESDVCFHNDKGKSYCTLKCTAATAATVCGVAPFDGKCNGKGYCRLP